MKYNPRHISPWYLAEFDRADRHRERAWIARSIAWAAIAIVLTIVSFRADAATGVPCIPESAAVWISPFSAATGAIVAAALIIARPRRG